MCRFCQAGRAGVPCDKANIKSRVRKSVALCPLCDKADKNRGQEALVRVKKSILDFTAW